MSAVSVCCVGKNGQQPINEEIGAFVFLVRRFMEVAASWTTFLSIVYT